MNFVRIKNIISIKRLLNDVNDKPQNKKKVLVIFKHKNLKEFP